ncbi:MAG: hypothetical protein KDD94_09505, partial [Calditrichaeota bacterium]|nr:hypothetical protein [Calditrichota bacterium]
MSKLIFYCLLIILFRQMPAQLYPYKSGNYNAMRFAVNFTHEKVTGSQFASSNATFYVNANTFHLITEFYINHDRQFYTPTDIRIIEKPDGVDIGD